MAQEGVIRNFMVALGFKTDNTGLGQMQDAMKGIELKAVALKGALFALATGAVVAVRQTASELDKLYFSSQRIGASATNITAFGNAITQMGGNAESAIGTLESLAEKVRNSPGYEGMLNSLGVDTKQANGDMRDRVEVMKDLSVVLAQMPAYQANAYAQSLGIDQNTLLAMRDGKFLSNMEKYQKIQEQLGMNDDLTKSGNEFMTEYRDLTMMTKTGFQVVVMQAGKALIPILRLLNQLLQSGIQAFSQLNPEIKNMLGIGLRFTLVALAFSGMIRVFGLLGKFLPTIKNLIWLLKALRLAFLSSPLGMILALGTALALLYDDYKTWREGGKSLIDWSKWSEDIDKGLAILGSIYDWVSSLVSKVINEFGRLDPAIQAIIGSISGLAIIGVLIAKHGFGIKYFTMARKSALGLAKVLRALFKVFALTPIGRAIALIGLLTTAIGWLIKDFNKWKSGADSFLPWAKWSKSIDRIMDKIRSFLNLLGDVKDKVVNFVQKIISDPVEAVNEVVDTAKDTLKTKDSGEPSQPVKTINEVSKNIVDGANNIVGKVLDVGTTTVTALAESVRAITQKGVEAVVNVGKSVDGAVKTTIQESNKLSNTIVKVLSVDGKKRVYQMADGATETRDNGTVAWRNNNPGNLKFEFKGSADKTVKSKRSREKALSDAQKRYQGVVDLDQWGNAIFATPELGASAKAQLLKRNFGNLTIPQMLKKYAKSDYSGKANYKSYENIINSEAGRRGVSLTNKIISGLTKEEFEALAMGMVIAEGLKKGSVQRTGGSNILPVSKNTNESNIQTFAPPTSNPNKEQVNQTNSSTKSSQVTIHQEYKTEMTINGARDPQASAQAVKRSHENANIIMARNAVGPVA
ncbi:hypothetical protein RWU60_07525 [Acinetobacter baumannii]|uniref:hypothetical protein n=1 Tax=Acinetobacter baumannii TaxID=470 RepID=UPI0029585201|nr:hypothetical protein [Acinetobacter baumannii]WNX61349.1 hypothetical protein RWU60_07525 [Acinetobacter baumannii]